MNLSPEQLDKICAAYNEAAEKEDEALHVPCEEYPHGFHTKDDGAIIQEAGMKAALAMYDSLKEGSRGTNELRPQSECGEYFDNYPG